MIKTLVFLAVAYGLRALLQPHGSSRLSSRRRHPGQVLLYSLATMGVLAISGIAFMVVLAVGAAPPTTQLLPLSDSLPQQAALTPWPPEAGNAAELPPVQAVQPGTRPAYVMLNTAEPIKSPAVEKQKTRSRGRVKIEKKFADRPKSAKKP